MSRAFQKNDYFVHPPLRFTDFVQQKTKSPAQNRRFAISYSVVETSCHFLSVSCFEYRSRDGIPAVCLLRRFLFTDILSTFLDYAVHWTIPPSPLLSLSASRCKESYLFLPPFTLFFVASLQPLCQVLWLNPICASVFPLCFFENFKHFLFVSFSFVPLL